MINVGNYQINIKFGDVLVPILPQMIEKLTITQDIDRVFPTFSLAVKDAPGLLGEVVPFDKNLNNMDIEIARGTNPDDFNSFNFHVKRRKVYSDRIYEVEGLLNIQGLLSPIKQRVLTGNVKANIETVVNDELEITKTEVGASLDYDKIILQPFWNNIKLFRYLKDNLIGSNNECGFYCFVKNVKGKRTFVFKSMNELFLSPVSYKFIVAHKQYETKTKEGLPEVFYPVSEYKIFDNSQFMSDFAAKMQQFYYFDYDTGTIVDSSINIEDCPALPEHFLIDNDNDIQGFMFPRLGRTNDFTSNFQGRVRNSFYRRATEFIHMWISTWGLENISPGDIVQVIFSEAMQRGKLFLYQHSGYWMVKRVVHIVGATFMTNLLLTRCGIDTDIATTLMEAPKRKTK